MSEHERMRMPDFVERTITLTDAEWMSLIDGSEARGGLMACCGNISDLRDAIMTLARNASGEQYGVNWTRFARVLGAALDGHDLDDLPALVKLREQMDLEAMIEHVRDVHREAF